MKTNRESNMKKRFKPYWNIFSIIGMSRTKIAKIWSFFFQKKTNCDYLDDPQIRSEPILSLRDWSGNDYVFTKAESKRRTIIRTKGKVHNIKKIFNRLNQEHFNGEIKAKITWGKFGCRNVQRFKNITFGTYSPSELLIRIHPALDSAEVPEYFVEHVIHHEILHEVIPPIMGNGYKWKIHHHDFRIAEAATPSYKTAIEWQVKNSKNVFYRLPIVGEVKNSNNNLMDRKRTRLNKNKI